MANQPKTPNRSVRIDTDAWLALGEAANKMNQTASDLIRSFAEAFKDTPAGSDIETEAAIEVAAGEHDLNPHALRAAAVALLPTIARHAYADMERNELDLHMLGSVGELPQMNRVWLGGADHLVECIERWSSGEPAGH